MSSHWRPEREGGERRTRYKSSVQEIIYSSFSLLWYEQYRRINLVQRFSRDARAINLVMYYSAFSLLICAVFIINPREFGFLLFFCWITTSKILMVFLWIRTLRFGFSLHTWGLNFQGMLFPCWTSGASSFWMCPTSCLCSKISITY